MANTWIMANKKSINVTSNGVEKILKGLNVTKAMGPDSIHPRVLKELSSELAEILAHFFQQSTDKGNIPILAPSSRRMRDEYQVITDLFR